VAEIKVRQENHGLHPHKPPAWTRLLWIARQVHICVLSMALPQTSKKRPGISDTLDESF
jgi:hypothetical protein